MNSLRVNSNLAELAKISHYKAQQLAKLLGIGRRQLERQFRDSLGIPPQACLNRLRQAAAIVLLAQPFSIKEIADQLGYKQTSHFSREFTKVHQESPRQFRRQMQGLAFPPLEAP